MFEVTKHCGQELMNLWCCSRAASAANQRLANLSQIATECMTITNTLIDVTAWHRPHKEYDAMRSVVCTHMMDIFYDVLNLTNLQPSLVSKG